MDTGPPVVCGSSVFGLGIQVCSQVKLEMEILIWVGYGECGGQLIITDRIKDDIASRSKNQSQCALKALNLHSLQWPAGGDSFGCKSNSACTRVFGPHLFLIYYIIKQFLDGFMS